MSDEFIEYVMELFGPFGTVGARRMFGGYGVYLDGLMFAIVAEDTLYLKADEMNRAEFEQAGCEIFGYGRKGKRATLNFFRAPEDAMESPELMLPWARTAYAAALRTNAKKQSQTMRDVPRSRPDATPRATALSGTKKVAQKRRAAQPAGKKSAHKRTGRPAKPAKEGKRK
jgi:DNA transformation protein